MGKISIDLTIFTTDRRCFRGRSHCIASAQVDQHYHSQRKMVFCKHFVHFRTSLCATCNPGPGGEKSAIKNLKNPRARRKKLLILKLFQFVGVVCDPKVNWRLKEGIKERKCFFLWIQKKMLSSRSSTGDRLLWLLSLSPAPRSDKRLVFNVYFQLLSDGRL